MVVLITGSAGYIGSHVAQWLIKEGRDFIGLDNLHRGMMENNRGPLVVGDIRRIEDIRQVFDEVESQGNKIDAVIHMAALTSVPESMTNKDEYEEVNLDGTKNLIQVMKEHNCNKLVFSSTASVYRQSNEPVREIDPIEPLNNYALTKYQAEQFIKENKDWLNAVIFRYFNVIGYADDYDKSTEFAKTNIIPALIRTLSSGETFKVFGNGHPVKRNNPEDHTCVRDYIDVRDIARAHGDALKYLENNEGQHLFNLGTKIGYSVLELLNAFEKANNLKVNYEIVGPRKGDPASVVANNQKAHELLHWCPLTPLEVSLNVTNAIKEDDFCECCCADDKGC